MEGKINLKKLETPKYKVQPQALLFRKLSSSISNKNIIKSEISEFFNNPEKFFNPDSRVFINRKINLKKIIPIEEAKPIVNRSIRRKDSFRNSKNNSSKLSSLKEKNSILNKLSSDEKEEIPVKNFEFIDKERLKSIFISYKNASKNIFRNKNNNSSLNEENNNNKNNLEKKEVNKENIPKQLSIDLDVQNRRLITKKMTEKQNNETSKYLSRRLHKNETDLLFNSVHLYRFKKEILSKEESKDNNNKINNQSYLFKWTSSLRKPKHFFGKREQYINVGGENNPLWSIIVERYPITKEVSVKSGYNLNSKDFKDFIKKRNNDSKSNETIKKVENLDEIGIRGKDLFELEYKREMSGNKRKILYNVFIDNGKAIMYKDVNNIYGHETIYKNYNGRNCFRNKKKGFLKGNQSAKIINKMSLKDENLS